MATDMFPCSHGLDRIDSRGGKPMEKEPEEGS